MEPDLDYDVFINQLFAKAEESGVPLSGAFELTSRCSLDCKMCYIHRSEFDREAISCEKPTEWWMNLAKQAKDAGMLMLLLTGGEPLIRNDFEKIYLESRNLGLLVSVNTNATLIDENKVRFFADNPPNRLNITLYGMSDETYVNLCGKTGMFERVISAVRALKQAGVNIKLNFSVTQYNRHDVEKAYAFSRELDVPIQHVSYMFPPVRTCGEADRLSPIEAAGEHFKWQKLRLGDKALSDYLDRKLNSRAAASEKINCRAALSTFWITWQGMMTPCGMMPQPSVRADDFSSAWSLIRSERERICFPSKCLECSLRNVCDICPAISFAETGRFDGVPDYLCKKSAEYRRLCEEFLEKRQLFPDGD